MQVEHPFLYGLEDQHLVECLGYLLEANTAAAFFNMQQAASTAGIDIQICSGYRDFDKQLSIWNAKASGRRAVLDKASKPVSIESLCSNELIDTILLWSALPGMSRHHWGTDIDIFDGNRIKKPELQLVPAEYQHGGPCLALSQWLHSHAEKYGFYLPYQQGLSGVSPEPWHLSYFPISKDYINSYDIDSVKTVLACCDILHKDEILERIAPLVNEYVLRVAPVPTLKQPLTET
ncbi:peptidase M15B and M15C DD-carboxypeptidase VanY/endolysin [Shewanella halifaxensis HAW-EB4]|uniref:Peptidase M15B and M15C DD-carboxypeptidase VanY/endolysin n=1 Tax=Shewanella halifaxensis (strain HAW-EB4) TaxID=458817 RepID=B0TVI5_SHEHH|nr:M15 family metallopeptidase [Shewanella halifaxensis]ABZ76870.1 peptidase M15B and M15C DD-carboxypeptidase VanY/endolysin [Shewanella halifaxensis HAW-EB4]